MRISGKTPLRATLASLALLMAAGFTSHAAAAGDDGVQLDLRYRLEQVDQQGFDRDALASTLRTRLGYRFAEHAGWGGTLSLQDNHVLGNDLYNSTRNGRTTYPVVADPQDTEVDQAYVEYSGWQPLDMKLGRQVIKLDNDRFVGNVGFRQLEQSFDALRVSVAATSALGIDYAYLTRVNRIFGAHHPDALHARQNLDAHLLNIAWTGAAGKLVGYLYLIGNQSQPEASHRDIGLRWTGKTRSFRSLQLDYTLEAARQSRWRHGTLDGSRNYLHARARLISGNAFWMLGQERLQGNGRSALQTPLATLHAFNGWADRFLSTPPDGLADSYLGAGWTPQAARFSLVAHHFAATHGSRHYGDELDMSAGKSLDEHVSMSAALADYHRHDLADDTRILWLTLEYSL